MEVQTDFIQTELQRFNLSDAAILQMRSEYLPILVQDHTDKEHASKAREARLIVKDHRVNVEKMRKFLKEDSLKFGKAVDAEAKRITVQLDEIETHLQTQEDIVYKYQQRLEAEARAKAEQERIEKEKSLEVARQALEVEKQKIEAARQALEVEKQKIEAARQALEVEKRKIEIEKQRQLELEKAKQEAERQAIEAEKRKIEIEKQRQIELENAKQEAAKRAIAETEQRLKREAEEKQRLEREKIEREAREIEEQKRREANAPDKEKLIAFVGTINNIKLPEVKGVEAQKIVLNIKQRLYELSEYCSRQITNL